MNMKTSEITKELEKRRKMIRNAVNIINSIEKLKTDLIVGIDDVLHNNNEVMDYKKDMDVRCNDSGSSIRFQITVYDVKLRRSDDV